MTVALEGCEGSAASPGHSLPPGKTRYPFYRRLGGPQGWSGWAENLGHTGIQSQTVQPVVSRCTNWANRPTFAACAGGKSVEECGVNYCGVIKLPQDSSISVVTLHLNIYGPIPGRGKKFYFFCQVSRTVFGVHPASCSVGKRGSCPHHRMAGAWGKPHIAIKCQSYEWVKLYFHTNHMPSWRTQGQILLHAVSCGTTMC